MTHRKGILKDLERLMMELDFEDVLAAASETFEIRELMEDAARVGSDYYEGYRKGLSTGRDLAIKYWIAASGTAQRRYEEFAGRWRIRES